VVFFNQLSISCRDYEWSVWIKYFFHFMFLIKSNPRSISGFRCFGFSKQYNKRPLYVFFPIGLRVQIDLSQVSVRLSFIETCP
jgi:hypothetical protein